MGTTKLRILLIEDDTIEVMKHITEQPLMRWVHVEDSKLGIKDSLEIPGTLAYIWIAFNLNYKYPRPITYFDTSLAMESGDSEYVYAA